METKARWLASWALYWAGDAIHRLANIIGGRIDNNAHWRYQAAYRLYRLHHKIMGWSVLAQGNKSGAWERY